MKKTPCGDHCTLTKRAATALYVFSFAWPGAQPRPRAPVVSGLHSCIIAVACRLEYASILFTAKSFDRCSKRRCFVYNNDTDG